MVASGLSVARRPIFPLFYSRSHPGGCLKIFSSPLAVTLMRSLHIDTLAPPSSVKANEISAGSWYSNSTRPFGAKISKSAQGSMPSLTDLSVRFSTRNLGMLLFTLSNLIAHVQWLQLGTSRQAQPQE